MTTHAEVARSDDVKAVIPALAALAELIGDPAVRNRGTIGGSIANNDPAADYPGAVLALGATVRTNKREIAADDFFKGMFETALEPDEIVTAVHFPKPAKAAYEKFRNPAVALRHGRRVRGQDRQRRARRGHRRRPVRVPLDAMRDGAGGQLRAGRDRRPERRSAGGLNGDIHASAEYRAHLIKVMAKRAVAAAA